VFPLERGILHQSELSVFLVKTQHVIREGNYGLIAVFFIFSVLFIGSDLYSISIGGFTVRIIQLFYVFCFLFLAVFLKIKISLSAIVVLLPFAAIHFVSSFFSVDYIRSIMFSFWLVYNYIFIVLFFYSLCAAITDTKGILYVFDRAFVIVGLLIILSFALGVLKIRIPIFGYQDARYFQRPSLWFYEPSYLALFFIIYYGIYLYLYFARGSKEFFRKLVFSVVSLFCITSSGGFLGIVLGFFLILLWSFANRSIRKMKVAVIIILSLGIGIGLIYWLLPSIFSLMIGRLFAQGLVSASQGRVTGWQFAWEIFLKNPIVGIGPGAYETYTGYDTPPTNVILEIFCTTGLLGFFSFMMIILYVLFSFTRRNPNSNGNDEQLYIAFRFSMVLFLVVMQFNQNYLRLYFWMFIGILLYLKDKERQKHVVRCQPYPSMISE